MRLAVLLVVLLIAPIALPSVALAKEGQSQPPPDFVPVENAPAGEQIPAMPLLGLAYGFIWVGMFGYVWSIARRLQKVEAELTELESRKS
ncbi:MAG TPA: CcmD family protein [Vicinamibacterales bacterium]|nr:CcmD family protein [Vicinamibacterales bacterium]